MTDADEAMEHFSRSENELMLGLHSTFVMGKVLAQEIVRLTGVIQDQHYYETDCHGCRDNKENADKALGVEAK